MNGVLCHETGCPDAWRDRRHECFECGVSFAPEFRYHEVCNDCAGVFDEGEDEDDWDNDLDEEDNDDE